MKNRTLRYWARVTGTVLFGLHTLGLLGVLADSHPGIGLTKVLTTLSWLIACGAVVFLWQRPSSAFFQRVLPARSSRPPRHPAVRPEVRLRCGIPGAVPVLHNSYAQPRSTGWRKVRRDADQTCPK